MRILDNLIFRAEELGEVKIQYRLGVIYQTGDRVEQDLEQARHWFERAAGNGHEEATRILATMGGKAVKPKALKAQKRGDSKVKSSAKEKSAANDLPPVIPRKPRQQSLDLESGLEGSMDCPHGHGPLQEWKGNLRCWICGWSDEQPASSHPIAAQPEPAPGAMGQNLGFKIARWLGNKPRTEPPTEKPEEGKDAKKGGMGFDVVWVIGGVVYLLTRSC
jgi:hypothetical protein